MTAFATCAFTGCYEKIPYNPKEDATRPRYCKHHMQHMRERSPSIKDDDWLYIAVVRKTVQEPVSPVKRVVMICPACKERRIVSEAQWVLGNVIPCSCGGKMVFHKDADNHTKDPGNGKYYVCLPDLVRFTESLRTQPQEPKP